MRYHQGRNAKVFTLSRRIDTSVAGTSRLSGVEMFKGSPPICCADKSITETSSSLQVPGDSVKDYAPEDGIEPFPEVIKKNKYRK